jgi:hypothetical protein
LRKCCSSRVPDPSIKDIHGSVILIRLKTCLKLYKAEYFGFFIPTIPGLLFPAHVSRRPGGTRLLSLINLVRLLYRNIVLFSRYCLVDLIVIIIENKAHICVDQHLQNLFIFIGYDKWCDVTVSISYSWFKYMQNTHFLCVTLIYEAVLCNLL